MMFNFFQSQNKPPSSHLFALGSFIPPSSSLQGWATKIGTMKETLKTSLKESFSLDEADSDDEDYYRKSPDTQSSSSAATKEDNSSLQDCDMDKGDPDRDYSVSFRHLSWWLMGLICFQLILNGVWVCASVVITLISVMSACVDLSLNCSLFWLSCYYFHIEKTRYIHCTYYIRCIM